MKYLAQINFFHDNDLTVTDYPNIFRFNNVFTLPSEPTNFIVFNAETEEQAEITFKEKIKYFLKDGRSYFQNKDNILNSLASEFGLLERDYYDNDFYFEFEYVLSNTSAFFDFEEFQDDILGIDGVGENITECENDFLDLTDEEIENIKLTKINDSCIYIFQGNNSISTKFKDDGGENIYSRTEFEFRFLLIPVDEITSDFQSKFLSYGSKNDDFKDFLKSYNLKNNLDSFICYFVNEFYINGIGKQIRNIKRTDYFKDPDFEIKKLLNTSLAEYIKE